MGFWTPLKLSTEPIPATPSHPATATHTNDDTHTGLAFVDIPKALDGIDEEIRQGHKILKLCSPADDALDRCTRFYVYLLVAFRDLHLMMHAVMREKHAATQNVLARYLAVHLSEFFDDIHHAISKYLGPQLRSGDVPTDVPELIKAFKQIASKLAKPEREWLASIRNFAAAHRDIDPIAQIDTIHSVDVHRILDTSVEVSDIVHSIIVLVKMSGMHAAREGYFPFDGDGMLLRTQSE